MRYQTGELVRTGKYELEHNAPVQGFLKERYIGENVRLISDIMEQTQVNNTPGILISVDFKKAFDSLEWSRILVTA